MGDAATCVALPRLWVELALTDSAGEPVTRGAPRPDAALLGPRGGPARAASRCAMDGAVAMLIEDSQEVDSVRRASSTAA